MTRMDRSTACWRSTPSGSTAITSSGPGCAPSQPVKLSIRAPETTTSSAATTATAALAATAVAANPLDIAGPRKGVGGAVEGEGAGSITVYFRPGVHA